MRVPGDILHDVVVDVARHAREYWILGEVDRLLGVVVVVYFDPDQQLLKVAVHASVLRSHPLLSLSCYLLTALHPLVC